jgi:Rv0078B-related antitoxin
VSDSQAALRLRLALDMYEFGVQMERSRLRRQAVGLIEARGFNRDRDLRSALNDLVVEFRA